MRRVMAKVMYDGSAFFGYQIQIKQDNRTVQGEVEKALNRIFKEHVETYGAGRTDTGVHAVGQIITFRVKYDTMYDRDVKNALNANLPNDIYVSEVKTVADNFNPRFLASRRIYHYYIQNTSEPDIFCRNKYWWFPYNINVPAMREGAKYMEGVHNFTTFMKKTKGVDKDPVRVIYRVRIFELKNKIILIRVEGHSYLRRMVRNIVGALIRVGTGQWEPEMIKTVISQRNRASSSTCAPPDGLYLYSVEFNYVDEMKYIKNALWSENELMEGKNWCKAE